MSGFFGVTSLGPIFPIGSNLLSTLGVTSFADDDFKQAFSELSINGILSSVDGGGNNMNGESNTGRDFNNETVGGSSGSGSGESDSEPCIRKIDVYEVLTRTYGFEPMPEELNLFVQTMALDQEGTLSWSDFEKGLLNIRDKVQKIGKKATHYDSYQDYTDDRTKHSRAKYGPMEVYKRPMTTAQSIGWHDEEVFNERFPKSSCPETKYMDAVVKSGWGV